MHHFKAIDEFKLYSPKTPKSCQNGRFFVTRDPEIWQMTLKTIGHLFYNTSSIVLHLKASAEFKPESLSGNSQFGSKSVIFVPRDLDENLKNDLEKQ